MSKFRIFLVFFALLKLTVSDGSPMFLSETELFEFLEKWTVSETTADVRAMQSTFARHLMNTSVDPCENFYEFACGNFENLVPKEAKNRHGDIFTLIDSFGDYLLNNAITDGRLWEQREYENVRNLYLSCTDNDTWTSGVKKGERVLGEFVANFADWPIFQNGYWDVKLDLESTVARADSHGIKTLFHHKIKEKDGVFYDSLEPVQGFEIDMEELMNKAVLAGIDLTDKESDLYNAILFMERLYELATDTKEDEEYIYSITKLSKLYPDFDYGKYFERLYFGGTRITSSSRIYIPKQRQFQQMNELIAQTDEKVLANSIFISMFGRLALAHTSIFSSRPGNMCAGMVKAAMHFSLLKWLSENYLKESTEHTANNLARSIQSVAYTYFKKKLSRYFVLRKHTPLLRIYSPKREVFYPLTTGIKPLLDALQAVEFDPKNLFSNFLKIVKIKKRLELTKASIKILDSNMLARFPEERGVIVPVTMFLPPFYHENSPRYVKYGSLGSYIAKQIFDDVNEVTAINLDCYYSIEACANKKGIEIATIAYNEWLVQHINNTEATDIEINGKVLDGIQGLYLSSAQSMCSEKLDDPEMVKWIWNFPAFKEAFNCPTLD